MTEFSLTECSPKNLTSSRRGGSGGGGEGGIGEKSDEGGWRVVLENQKMGDAICAPSP